MITMEIKLDPVARTFEVTAPFADLGMCYQLLKLAEDICRIEHAKVRKQQENGIVGASALDVSQFART